MSQTREEMRKNILLNYENFLTRQRDILKMVTKNITNRLENYENSYKAYFMDNFNSEKKQAYEIDLEEIRTFLQQVSQTDELLEIFGLINEEKTQDNLERLHQYKIDNERLKELEKQIKDSDDASKPQKENFGKQYQYGFLTLLSYIVLLIGIIVIAYIQITNRGQ